MAEPKTLEWPAVDLHIDEWASLGGTGLECPYAFLDANLPKISDCIGLPVEAFIHNTMAYCSLVDLPSTVFASGLQSDYYKNPNPQPPDSAGYITTKEAFDLSHRSVRDHFIILMTTQIVSCWTAFETLARDLWIAAVNARPRIGVRVMGAEDDPGDDDDTADKKRKVKFPFSVKILEKWDYDLTNHMGDALSHERWKFDRKDNSEKAYKAAFGKECQDEIESIFDSKELGWLCAIRNNLVHRAGIVDDDLKRQTKNCPGLETIQADGTSRIPIEGKLCRNLVDSGCKAGVELAKMVDAWLVQNPK